MSDSTSALLAVALATTFGAVVAFVDPWIALAWAGLWTVMFVGAAVYEAGRSARG